MQAAAASGADSLRDPRRPRTRRQSARSLPDSPALQPPVAACGAAAAPDPSTCLSTDPHPWNPWFLQRWCGANGQELQSSRATSPRNSEYQLDPQRSDTEASAQGYLRGQFEPKLQPLLQRAPCTQPPACRLPEENPTMLTRGCGWGWRWEDRAQPAPSPARILQFIQGPMATRAQCMHTQQTFLEHFKAVSKRMVPGSACRTAQHNLLLHHPTHVT